MSGRSGHKEIHYERVPYKLKKQEDYDGLGADLLDRFGYLSGRVEFQFVRKLPASVLIEKINGEKTDIRYAIRELRRLGCSWNEIRTYAEGAVIIEIDAEAVKAAADN